MSSALEYLLEAGIDCVLHTTSAVRKKFGFSKYSKVMMQPKNR